MAQSFVYTGIPRLGADPSPAEWARISNEVGTHVEADAEIMAELGNLFRFQGMDPCVILKKFAQLGIAANRDWIKDAIFLIVLHICRGTKVRKILRSVKAEAAQEISDVTSIYHVTDDKPVGDAITLARIALCFPLYTLRQLATYEDQLTVRHHTMTTISPGYPIVLMHACFASLICDEVQSPQDVQDMLDAHRLYLVELTKVINVSMRTKSVAEIAETFEQPLMAGYGSTFITQAVRKTSLQRLGILSASGVLIQSVKAAAQVYRARRG